MTELTFSAADWTMDAAGTWLRIEADVPYKAQMFLEHMIPGKKYVAEIKEFRKKRSLDSNNYFWQLCDQIAGKLGRTKEDLYVSTSRRSACSRTSISPRRGRDIPDGMVNARDRLADRGSGLTSRTETTL
ncbi:MAG: hypothetical protein ACLR8L_00240 [Oscillospiraceae bacterium]